MEKYLYLNIYRCAQQMKVGDQFFHWVKVIEYVDNPLFGSHEKVCQYYIGYAVKEIIQQSPLIALLTVIQCKRCSGYSDLDANTVFHTQRGHQFYADGILSCNLPNIGDEFKAIDKKSEYDLCKGYIYSLHRYEDDEVN